MKFNLRQKIWLCVVLAVNLALWLIPSNIVEEIANDRHVMLNRYSRTHFVWIVIVFVLSIISFYVDWSTGPRYKRRWFQVLTITFTFLPALAILDYLVRTPNRMHYVRDSLAYRHVPNFKASAPFVDRPTAARSYPNAPPGYPTIARTLQTDARGYRNFIALEQADIVTVGDSFTEGSGVSDEQAWPALLGAHTGQTVYNLGMSGYDPLNYSAALKQFGFALKPIYVICMIYEGNDFRSAKSDDERNAPSLHERLHTYFNQSPLLGLFDYALTNTFGPIGSQRPVKGIEVLDWLPLRVPADGTGKHYAFAPKQLRDLLKSTDAFATDSKWLNTRRIIANMHAECRTQGAILMIAYAPLKAHVLLPLVADRLPPEKVRAFTALSIKRDLPDADALLTLLLNRADAMEHTVRDFCLKESITFLSTTSALREAAADAQQVYFTYDQHWTPEGHEVAADVVADYLSSIGARANVASRRLQPAPSE